LADEGLSALNESNPIKLCNRKRELGMTTEVSSLLHLSLFAVRNNAQLMETAQRQLPSDLLELIHQAKRVISI
jgi:hypothetical protein